jgi:acyl-homoserine lactone synthase
MRAIPTLKPTLMSEIFPYLNLRGEIRRADVYELSRVFVDPTFRGERIKPKIESQLMAAIMEYGLSTGISGFTIVLETWWLPRLADQGWKVRPLGLPVEMDGMSVVAVYVVCNEETWCTNCERRSIRGPLLEWNGLEQVSRLPMPTLSLHSGVAE